MMQTGGGLITNSRTSEPSNTLPKAMPAKQMAQQPQQQAPAPQPQPQQQGGLVSPPQQQAPAPQPQPQQQPPQGGMGPQPGQGEPPPGGNQQAPQGINDAANNALQLLHDPEAAPQFEQMIAQGPKGAAQAAATIYEQVAAAHEQHGSPISDEMAGEAAEAIISDISDIGTAIGSFQMEPLIDGIPASAMEFIALTGELLAPKFPAIAAEFQAIAAEGADPGDDAAAQQLAQYMGGTNGQG